MIGVTIGDPAGIGPEITIAAIRALPREFKQRLVVYGDNLPDDLGVEVVGAGFAPFVPGRPDERSGAAQVAYLEAAVKAPLEALVTAPISKTWAKRAGFAFADHTTFLAARYGAPHVVMLFAGPRLKVALATIHVPLAQVPLALTTASLRATIALVTASLVRDFGIAAPRVGVVGLNPHAGEGGLLGTEDRDLIAPACGAAFGPLVPDAAFRDAVDGAKYDALIAMYHDQGLIPVKLIDFDESVNVTLGLPIIRTSPDHGTAFDIAGKGIARSLSMQRALELAFAMVQRRATAC